MARYTRKVSLAVPRFLALALLALLAAIQYPLWKGKGSVDNLTELRRQLAEQKQQNVDLQHEITRLNAEAESLREGNEALESRARDRLNMIKENEVLVRLSPK